MFSRFTASARRVMQRAFREAKRWHHDFVGTEHLLYGLLCDADGTVVQLMHSLNARPELMLQKVELSLQRHGASMAIEQFPLSPAVRRAIRYAADDAAQFQHQVIGPEHLLLGLLRENDSEAAQLLSLHAVAWNAVRDAVSRMPHDASLEAQIRPEAGQRLPLGDNPSAAELEEWIAPPMTVEHEIDAERHPLGGPNGPLSLPNLAESQLRLTQLVFGAVVGYTFGHWLFGWQMGAALAVLGLSVAALRNSWVGILAGTVCGLFLTPFFHPDLLRPLGPVMMGMLGAFLGGFLGDWRISSVNSGERQKSAETTATEVVEGHPRDKQGSV